MNILWITYGILGRASELFYKKSVQGGGWIDENINRLLPYLSEINLTILGIGTTDQEVIDENGVRYIECAEFKKIRGRTSSEDVDKWAQVLSKYNPDLIQVFGIEYANGLDIVKAASRIPVLYYIQGIMKAFIPYPKGNIPDYELIKTGNMDGIIKHVKYSLDIKAFEKQAEIEHHMINNCSGVIIDNDWARRCMQAYNSSVEINESILPVANCFLDRQWRKNTLEYKVFTIAGRTPYKGLHNAIRAIALLKSKYPMIKLYIPGNMNYADILHRPAYISYLNNQIKRLNVKDNIVFCGQLSPEEMADYMLGSDVFVMPSCIENHSSTLREAMYLGVPCVTSEVGCITELVAKGFNALSYRYDEYEQLAGCINDIFSNDELRYRLGQNAYRSIREKYPQEIIGRQLFEIYHKYVHNFK